VWEYLVGLGPAVILLYRKNVVRQAVNIRLARRHLQPRHSMATAPAVRVRMAPDVVLRSARQRVKATVAARTRGEEFAAVLEVSYGEMVGGEGVVAEAISSLTARRICEFLEVPETMMGCRLKPVNPRPLREVLVNWPEVERAIAASELAWCLEDEKKFEASRKEARK